MSVDRTDTTPEYPEQPPPTLPKPPRKRRRLLPTLGIGIVILVLLGVGGFVTASLLEEHDSFCIACHTVPETTYYDRAHSSLAKGIASADVPDLASAHYTLSKENNKPEFACINCHRGDSTLGNRIQTLTLGARDALIFVSGKANPAVEKGKIAEGFLPDASCVSCHTDTMLTLRGMDNHYHNALPQTAKLLANGAHYLLPSGQPTSTGDENSFESNGRTVETSVKCLSCHVAHKTVANGGPTKFTEEANLKLMCQKCHLDDPLSER